MNYSITREQLEQLTRIYNTLLEVQVKGEALFVLTDSLRALEQVVRDVSQQPEAAPEKADSDIEG